MCVCVCVCVCVCAWSVHYCVSHVDVQTGGCVNVDTFTTAPRACRSVLYLMPSSPSMDTLSFSKMFLLVNDVVRAAVAKLDESFTSDAGTERKLTMLQSLLACFSLLHTHVSQSVIQHLSTTDTSEMIEFIGKFESIHVAVTLDVWYLHIHNLLALTHSTLYMLYARIPTNASTHTTYTIHACAHVHVHITHT